MKSNLVDIEVKILVRPENGKAILVTQDDETKVWLPLSQIEIDEQEFDRTIITLPAWLALEKGLI